MPFVELGPVDTYYEDRGGGPPVLLLHSYFGTVDSWSAQRAPLASSYRVVATDARAHGRSAYSGGRLRLTDLVDDAAAVIEHLDLVPAHVVGSSLGALTALTLAVRKPELVATLTLIDPPHLDEPTCQDYMDRLVHEVFPSNEEAWEAPHRALGPHHVRDVLMPNFSADRREQPDDQRLAVLEANRIGRPALIVAGDRDPVFPLERALALRHRIDAAELLVLPRGGHFPHRAYPDVFNELLLSFLARHA